MKKLERKKGNPEENKKSRNSNVTGRLYKNIERERNEESKGFLDSYVEKEKQGNGKVKDEGRNEKIREDQRGILHRRRRRARIQTHTG